MNKIVMLSLLLLVALTMGCDGNDTSAGRDAGNQQTKRVERTNIVAAIEDEGEIAPLKSVEVKPGISGKVTEVLVNEGEFVEAGQKIAEVVADRDQTRALNAIVNNYKEAEINYENARYDYEYAKDLYDNDFISERELRDATNSYRIAERRFRSAEEEYRLALEEIDFTEDGSAKRSAVIAPLSGIVLERFIEAGELVSAETSTRSGTVLFNIADYTSFVVKVDINEFDIDRVSHGQRVIITRGRTGEQRYRGRVFKISPLAKQSDGVRVYPVEIEIEDVSEALRFGMTAAVRIITARANDVLSIPVTSLFVDERGQEYVMVKQQGEDFQKQYVERGINNIFMVEITEGLTEGDVVLDQSDGRAGTRDADARRGSMPGMPGMGGRR